MEMRDEIRVHDTLFLKWCSFLNEQTPPLRFGASKFVADFKPDVVCFAVYCLTWWMGVGSVSV